MAINKPGFEQLQQYCAEHKISLVAVSKTKPIADLKVLYELGQRDFGENYVQELIQKQPEMPPDTQWHFIGHLQSNKVKLIAPFVYLIHGVDSKKLLLEINKQGAKLNRIIHCLLQVHISNEETKFGFDPAELKTLFNDMASHPLPWLQIRGLMGMASFTSNQALLQTEFKHLHELYIEFQPHFTAPSLLSMGMTQDYHLAVAAGSNMLRIGSLIFGERSQS